MVPGLRVSADPLESHIRPLLEDLAPILSLSAFHLERNVSHQIIRRQV